MLDGRVAGGGALWLGTWVLSPEGVKGGLSIERRFFTPCLSAFTFFSSTGLEVPMLDGRVAGGGALWLGIWVLSPDGVRGGWTSSERRVFIDFTAAPVVVVGAAVGVAVGTAVGFAVGTAEGDEVGVEVGRGGWTSSERSCLSDFFSSTGLEVPMLDGRVAGGGALWLGIWVLSPEGVRGGCSSMVRWACFKGFTPYLSIFTFLFSTGLTEAVISSVGLEVPIADGRVAGGGALWLGIWVLSPDGVSGGWTSTTSAPSVVVVEAAVGTDVGTAEGDEVGDEVGRLDSVIIKPIISLWSIFVCLLFLSFSLKASVT
jgi:hypothetical protein